jgi:hypothetical protein
MNPADSGKMQPLTVKMNETGKASGNVLCGKVYWVPWTAYVVIALLLCTA